jgi:hypothetical protein
VAIVGVWVAVVWFAFLRGDEGSDLSEISGGGQPTIETNTGGNPPQEPGGDKDAEPNKGNGKGQNRDQGNRNQGDRPSRNNRARPAGGAAPSGPVAPATPVPPPLFTPDSPTGSQYVDSVSAIQVRLSASSN